MKRIVISGKSKSGKDTLCQCFENIINQNYINFNFYSLSFAKPIKDAAKILFPQIRHEWLFGESSLRSIPVPGLILNGNQVTVRDILIDIGERYKKYDENIFVRAFDFNIKKYESNLSVIVATDLRFTQEFEYAKKNNFTTIRIVRSNNLKLNDFTETNQDAIQDNEFQYIVENNSTLQDLYKKAESILTEIMQ